MLGGTVESQALPVRAGVLDDAALRRMGAPPDADRQVTGAGRIRGMTRDRHREALIWNG
jgi:hypothetical protein